MEETMAEANKVTCRPGYVPRDAFPGDTVCVTPERRAQVQYDNSQADARREPGGGAYGPATCISGYVWREAREGDVVCVTPDERSLVREENRTAGTRRVGGPVRID
jgi:hypothetical protein